MSIPKKARYAENKKHLTVTVVAALLIVTSTSSINAAAVANELDYHELANTLLPAKFAKAIVGVEPLAPAFKNGPTTNVFLYTGPEVIIPGVCQRIYYLASLRNDRQIFPAYALSGEPNCMTAKFTSYARIEPTGETPLPAARALKLLIEMENGIRKIEIAKIKVDSPPPDKKLSKAKQIHIIMTLSINKLYSIIHNGNNEWKFRFSESAASTSEINIQLQIDPSRRPVVQVTESPLAIF